MRRTLPSAFCLLTGLFVGIAGCRSSSPSPAPAVASPAPVAAPSGFEPSPVDLGRVSWLTRVEFESQFHNPRAETVSISAATSEGVARLSGPPLLGLKLRPGESIAVRGAIQTGEWPLGPRRAHVRLTLSDGTEHVLPVAYDCYPTYELTPNAVSFEAVDIVSASAAPTYESRRVVYRPATPSRIVNISSDADWLSGVALPRGDGSVEIEVRVDRSRVPHGKSEASVLLETTDEKQPNASIPVLVAGRSNPIAVPGRVELVRSEELVSFRTAAGAAAAIARFELEPSNAGVEVRQTQPARFVVRRAEGSKDVSPARLRVWTAEGAETHVWIVAGNSPRRAQRDR